MNSQNRSDPTFAIHTIGAGSLLADISLLQEGMALWRVTDKKRSHDFLRAQAHEEPAPLFTLTAGKAGTEETLTITSLDGWVRVGAQEVSGVHTLILADHRELPEVTVILTAVAGRDRISWTVRLHSENETFALYECDYPILSFRGDSSVKVFFPYGCGEVYSSHRVFSSVQNYPSYGASMEYMALWDTETGRGLYYGLHDPAPAYKKLYYCREEGKQGAYLKAAMPLRDMDRTGNSQTLEGETVWQLFDGDWYDAAMLYRDFFLRRASWKPERKDGKRTDTPEWLRTNSHWWRKRMQQDQSYVQELMEASRDLGFTGPVHLYDWFQIPYDTNYPHYFPAKDAFLPGIRKLREEGIPVMPYINGRLWDTRDRGEEDWQFTSLARPDCTKKGTGEPFLEIYPTSNRELAIMCPSSALWQEKLKEIAEKLFGECEADAVYLDQIGAAQAYPCEDPGHSHRPGGGTWWVESYRNLLDHIKRVMPEGRFLATECTSDPYMKEIQAYLSWIWVKNDQVPAFMAVYNGYVTVFGRCYDYAPEAAGQDILAAQSLTFGEQMGWIKPEVYQALEHKEFYKKCVRCRRELGSFFYDGRLLRSPVIRDDCHIKTTKMKAEAYGGLLEHTAAFSELWERKDGSRLLLLVNGADREDTPVITVSLPDGSYSLQGDLKGECEIREGKLSPVLPPLSVSWIVLS